MARGTNARAEVGLPDVRIHDLRHLAGTLGTLSGRPRGSRWHAWGTRAAALRYQHLVEGRGRTIAEGIDRLMSAARRDAESRDREQAAESRDEASS
jgi:hypothetical protein